MIWRARFFEESALFAPIREVAQRFAGEADFPSPERIDEVLRDRSPVGFVRQSQNDKEPYDARIVNEGIVKTRARSWHDFMNALVWSVFPLSKAALHRRQHELVVPGAPHRTAEHDALAMLDEGGVLLAETGAAPVVFGHAIYEAIVLRRTFFAAGVVVNAPPGELDRAASSFIADRSFTSRDLARVDLSMMR